MYRFLALLAVAFLAAAPALASDKTDVIAAVNQFLDGFNKGDVKAISAACADQTSIIDEFPPHEWHGAGACAKWAADYDIDAKSNVITDGVVTLGKFRHVDIVADHAYVVVPADYVYKKKGKTVSEKGSTMTLALQKVDKTWRITGWAWAKN